MLIRLINALPLVKQLSAYKLISLLWEALFLLANEGWAFKLTVRLFKSSMSTLNTLLSNKTVNENPSEAILSSSLFIAEQSVARLSQEALRWRV